MHSWKAGDETGSVQYNVLDKTSHLEKMGAFINLCHQSATEKGCRLIRNRSGCVVIHVYWREQYKVWLLSFIYIHIYIALGWWFLKWNCLKPSYPYDGYILLSCDSSEWFFREPHKSREWSGLL